MMRWHSILIALAVVLFLATPLTGQEEREPPSPAWAMLASALLPGGGQVYCDNLWKGLVFGAAQTLVLSLLLHHHTRAEDSWVEYQRTGSSQYYRDYSFHADRRYELEWWMAGIWALSIADAYVDAHMWGFDRPEGPALEWSKAGLHPGNGMVGVGLVDLGSTGGVSRETSGGEGNRE